MKQIIIYSIVILFLTGNIVFAQNNISIDSLLAESQHYIKKEQCDSALALCQKALYIDSLNPHIYNQMGIALVGIKEYDSAISYYQKAIDIEPHYVWAYYNIGVAYSKQEKYEQAIPWLKKAASMYKTPDWLVTTTLKATQSDFHYQKGLTYEEQGIIKRAIKEWKWAARNNSDAKEKLKEYGYLPNKYKK